MNIEFVVQHNVETVKRILGEIFILKFHQIKLCI